MTCGSLCAGRRGPASLLAGAPWCVSLLGSYRSGLSIGSVGSVGSVGSYGSGEDAEVRYEAVDVGFVVLDRDQPLLDLAPWREENAAVVLIEPVRVAVPVVHAQEAAVAGDGLGREHYAAFGAGGDHVGGEIRGCDGLLDSGRGSQAEVFEGLVGLGRGYLGEH